MVRHASARFMGVLMAVLALLTGGCAAQPVATPSPGASGPTRSPAKATVGLTYIPDVQFAPFYVGENEGTFDAAGVDVTLRHHGASEGLFTALAAGQEQLVIAGGDEMLQARAEGMDLVAIAQYYRRYPVVLIVEDASPIKTAADLRGRTVGVPGRYGETWFGLQVLLRGAGLTESDVTIQEIGYTQQAALTTKKVDAIVGFSNNDLVQFDSAGVATRPIPLVEDGPVPLVSISLVATRQWLDANPEAARAAATAMVSSVRATVDDPAGAVEQSKAFVPELRADAAAQRRARATLDATIPLWRGDGTIDGKLDPARWAAMSAFMSAQGLLKKPVEPGTAIATGVLG